MRGGLGRELLEYIGIAFRYWHECRDQRLRRDEFQAWMVPVRQQFEALLERAAKAEIDEVSASCQDMLAHREARGAVDLRGGRWRRTHEQPC
jgi:transposase